MWPTGYVYPTRRIHEPDMRGNPSENMAMVGVNTVAPVYANDYHRWGHRPDAYRHQRAQYQHYHANVVWDSGSTTPSDKYDFQVHVDVRNYLPDEISVKVGGGFVIVECKHEEKEDEHGYISRQFRRRYRLPASCNPDCVESRLYCDVLIVFAPKSTVANEERNVPITQIVRREVKEPAEIEAKEPQQQCSG